MRESVVVLGLLLLLLLLLLGLVLVLVLVPVLGLLVAWVCMYSLAKLKMKKMKRSVARNYINFATKIELLSSFDHY
jgi:hypothetical protein